MSHPDAPELIFFKINKIGKPKKSDNEKRRHRFPTLPKTNKNKRATTTDMSDIRRIKGKLYKELCIHIFDNINEIDQFLKKH